tara:strand:+ start:321 stop:1145 length:825 start_codon:yes stop_codon:yes gene_type:complete
MNMSALDMTRMSGIFSMPDASTSMNMDMDGKMGMSMPSEDMSADGNAPKDMGQNQSMMQVGDQSAIQMQSSWSFNTTILMFAMWWLMMIAMMVPSAAPTLLLFHALKKLGSEAHRALPQTYLFLLGYLCAWAFFSVAACLLQAQLEANGLASPIMMQSTSTYLSGALLVMAGIYQFTTLKNVCLDKCRSPAEFLAENTRKGEFGALIMGVHHGAFCLGCCWALMALLFVGGVMNLYWIIGIAIYVAIEKLLPQLSWLDKVLGVSLIGAGILLIV